MKELMIGFHRWMLKHDTADNAEEYFHYTDEDMVEEYLREYFKDDTSREDYWGPGWRDVSKPLETDTQDPAICNYSGLRPVEGYKEEELNKIVDTEEERKDEIDRLLIDTYRRGWLAGYDEGLYDGQYK